MKRPLIRSSETIKIFPERYVYFVSFAIFLIATVSTLLFSMTMSGGMDMPGNWTMSMMWTVMPGQTQFEAALMFLAMWVAMMVAMMLPSALPLFLLYRRAALFRKQAYITSSLWLLGACYFFVWTLFGAVAYALGRLIAIGAIKMSTISVALPTASGLALIVAGGYQLTPWKSACLAHCRDPMTLVANQLNMGLTGAMKLGLHHGLYCAGCCWSLMLIQLALGVMSLTFMVIVASVIALEKLLLPGPRIAQLVGYASILAGIGLFTQSIL